MPMPRLPFTPKSRPARAFPQQRRGRGLWRNDRGAVADEFGVLALPFFTLVYAILETSIVFLTGHILDSAVQDASRLVRTGQAQTAEWDEADFRDALCDGLYGLFDCVDVKIKVSKFATFQAAAPTP